MMSLDNPEALVKAFKNSGELDRFQKELLADLQKDESYSTFKVDIGDIVRQRLAKEQMLHYLPQDTVARELTQDVERYPIMDRTVKDMRTFSDPSFLSKIQKSLRRILQEDIQKRKEQSEMNQVDHRDSQSATVQTLIDNDPNNNSAAVHFQSKRYETGIEKPWSHDPQMIEARLECTGNPAPTSRPADDAMDVDD